MFLPLEQAYAQWPPFDFRLSPSNANGKIKYNIKFVSEFDGVMTNVAFKIPLPKGTRFLDADAQETTSTSFDGAEVTFFTTDLYTPIKDASFEVEITDPSITVFTTHAYIVWEGDQPGNFQTKDVVVDITRQPLNWEVPFKSRLQLETRATVTGDVVTFMFYPKNVDGSKVRMQDLKINVPIPEGATFLSAEASPAFTTNFDGQEVSFTTLEMTQGAEVAPLKVKVSTQGVTAPTIATHAWATWKNAGKRVGITTVAQEELTTGDLVVQLGTTQWVTADLIGDVPFLNYDLTSIAFEAYPDALKITLNTTGDIGSVGEPLEFILYLDVDCNTATGTPQRKLGADYRVKYDHSTGKIRLDTSQVNDTAQKWQSTGNAGLVKPVTSKMIAFWLPDATLALPDKSHFCWFAQAKNNLTAYSPNPPIDEVEPVQQDLKLTVSSAAPPSLITVPAKGTATKPLTGTFIEVGDIWEYLPGWFEPPAGWNTLDFHSNDWFTGTTSIGYGQGALRTNLKQVKFPTTLKSKLSNTNSPTATTILAESPNGDNGSVFMRRVFSVSDLPLLTQLNLKMKYEDGFVAYLNGVEVVRRNLGETGTIVPFNMPATKDQDRSAEKIDLSRFIETLVAGDNVLAIQAHRSLDNLNLYVAPRLTWKGKSAPPAPVDNPQAVVPVSAPAAPSASALAVTDITGKLAIPLDNSRVIYDTHIFSMPDGKEIMTIPKARQPNFRYDGQRLLVNHEGGGVENLFEYNLADSREKQVSDAPRDSHPFYDSGGNRVVYANAELTYGKPEQRYNSERNRYYFTGVPKPFIFVQCGLLPPHEEKEPRCRDIPSLGVLVPAGQTSEIQGTHPVWTSNDMIAYKGCNSWAGFSACGIYIVPSASTKGFSDGFIPRQLTKDASDIPTDTKGN